MISTVADVAIGVIVLWIVLAGLASTILEAVRVLFRRRQRTLFAVLSTLLDDSDRPTVDGAAATLYRSSAVRHLIPWRHRQRRGDQPPLTWYRRNPGDPVRRLASNGPEWIPSSVFASAINRGTLVGRLSDGAEQAIADENGDPDPNRAGVWFDEAMEVVSVGYRRTTRGWLFLIGLILAIGLQADAIGVANDLWSDQTARDQLAQRTGGAKPGDPTDDILTALPIGWRCDESMTGCPLSDRLEDNLGLLTTAGWLITGVAVSLGAPFWFDVVGRIRRATGRRASPAQETAGK